MLRRKLRSNAGMSILLALLLLLVCVVAGTAALTSAASNAGRYTHLRQDQQRYLAVASAVQLVRDELCAGEYTATATLTETTVYRARTDGEGNVVGWRPDPDSSSCALVPLQTGTGVYTGAFQKWLGGHLTKLFTYQEVPGDWWGQTYNPAQTDPNTEDPGALSMTGLQVDAGGEELLSKVRWTLKLNKDYGITAHFWLEEDGVKYYETRLTIPANREVSESVEPVTVSHRESQTVTTRTMKVTWPIAGAVIRQSEEG